MNPIQKYIQERARRKTEVPQTQTDRRAIDEAVTILDENIPFRAVRPGQVPVPARPGGDIGGPPPQVLQRQQGTGVAMRMLEALEGLKGRGLA